MKDNSIIIDLGFIGHKAAKLALLYNGYSPTPNEHGKFLNFQNYSSLVVNKGVSVHTNCWTNEADFLEFFYSKLLLDY